MAANATCLVNNSTSQRLHPVLLPLGRLLTTQASPRPQRLPSPAGFPRAVPPGPSELASPSTLPTNSPGRGGTITHTAMNEQRPRDPTAPRVPRGVSGGARLQPTLVAVGNWLCPRRCPALCAPKKERGRRKQTCWVGPGSEGSASQPSPISGYTEPRGLNGAPVCLGLPPSERKPRASG